MVLIHTVENLGSLTPNRKPLSMIYEAEEMDHVSDTSPCSSGVGSLSSPTPPLMPGQACFGKDGRCKDCKCQVVFIECKELPFGWEKVEDPHYGTYYIDHVNRKTQYENPAISAKRQAAEEAGGTNTLPRRGKSTDPAKRSVSESEMNGRGTPPDYSRHRKVKTSLGKRAASKRVFTKNPQELKGEIFRTSIVKSARGLGFTIIGGDHPDEEFLQIKNIVENGPAYLDGRLQTGDVLVYVNDYCVLGYTHQDVVRLFQTIHPGDSVNIEACRGYPLPFDPDDPNIEINTTVAVSLPDDSRGSNSPGSYSSRDNPNVDPNVSQKSIKSLPDLAKSANVHQNSNFTSFGGPGKAEDAPDVLGLLQPSHVEYLAINIVRGEMGFGFTIADSPFGQKVKQILDKPRCKNLQENDILHEINEVQVKDMSHSQIVQVLKECPKGEESRIVIQRGGIPLRPKKPPKPPEDSRGETSFGSGQPGAYFFNSDKPDSVNLPVNGDLVNRANQDALDGYAPEVPARPKTPTEPRAKTPTMSENRPKTPTRLNLTSNTMDPRHLGSRSQFSDTQPLRPPNSAHLPRKEYFPRDDSREFGHGPDVNVSRGSDFHNSSGSTFDSRPPPGPRYDPFRQDFGQGRGRTNFTMQNRYDRDRDPRYDYNRSDSARPGQFRSRTPGPEIMQRTQGPDYRPEPQRPKTPTAQDMRSKTPVQGIYGNVPGGNPDFMSNSRYQNSWGTNGPYRQGGYEGPQRVWGQSIPEHPVSPNMPRRNEFMDTFGRNFGGNTLQGAGRSSRQSTSFETEDPRPSNITRVPKRHPFQNSSFSNQVAGFPYRTPEEGNKIIEMNVTLKRQESGFGFRIIGGTEEGSQVAVGHIVPNGAADLDGRLRSGDEILYVDGMCVVNSSHHQVVQLMGNASLRGQVTLGVRRRMLPPTEGYPYDVTVTRRENEGFGFVIISSVTKAGSTIGEFVGRILENSPAERCGLLHVGDRILAVNGVNISHLHHEDIVNIIKESGFSVTLSVGPPQDDTSSNASTSQRSSAGSMINAMAYPAMNDIEPRRPELPFHSGPDRLRYPPPPPPPKDFARRGLMNHQDNEEEEIYTVELNRGSRGFGFSIRGGTEFNNMPLFVLRIADGGAADLDGRLSVGDQLLEINNHTTDNMTHSEAIDIIQNGGPIVRLLVKRTGKPPPSFEPAPSPGGRYPPTGPMANGPIGQSSPYLGRRNIDRDDHFYANQGGRAYPNY